MQNEDPKLVARRRIAGNVRAEAARAGHSGAAVARFFGMTRQAFHRRWTGASPYRDDELVRVAEWLGVPLVTLLADREQVAA